MNKLISEEVKFDGVRFNVVQKVYQREDGKTFVRDCVNPGDAAVVLPIDEAKVIFEALLRLPVEGNKAVLKKVLIPLKEKIEQAEGK